jgi:hypothetical protein
LNKALGYSEEQAVALWDLEQAAYTRQAAQNRVSIADFAYQMAQATGYQPQSNGSTTPAVANGTVAANANGRERIEQIQRAQRLQGLGSKVASAEGDPHANVKTMNAIQFDAYLEKFGAGDAWMDIKNTDPVLWKVIENKFADLG